MAAVVRRSSQLSAAPDQRLVRPADGLHAVADAVETIRLLARLHRAAARHLSRLHCSTTHASTSYRRDSSLKQYSTCILTDVSPTM